MAYDSTDNYVRRYAAAAAAAGHQPAPSKEFDLVKETQGAAELDGSERDSVESDHHVAHQHQPHHQSPYHHHHHDQSHPYHPHHHHQQAPYQPSSAPHQPRRKVRILSLDGGGIRGYSTLVILGELMHQIYVQEHGGRPPKSPADMPRPCEYFDLIGGNGTGGLIALMLGRMRMDVESCKSYYVSLTRFVFITDKTLLGLPYGKTLFKASRLEEAIRHCVRESTRLDQDSITPQSPPLTDAPPRIAHRRTDSWRRRRRSSTTTTAEQDRAGAGDGSSISSSRRSMTRRPQAGNPETSLLDSRDGACKTFVTAMLEGSRKGTPPVLLRSYPSPVESVPSYRTTIWQAGRATCATAAAFKSITIDQTTFLDEGAGMYNPALQVLDEAHLHEFADCDVATFVSVGTGKRQQPSVTGSGAGAAAAAAAAAAEKREWWEGMAFEGFSEAKRRLVRRIDDCERVHRELVDGDDGGRPKLAQGGVAAQDYYRFNVEVGVGEFGMNEWNRLAEVATGTRRYLSQRETSRFVKECAAKLAAVAASRTQPQPQPQPQPQSHQQPKPQSQPQSSPQSPPPPQQLKSPPPPPPPPQPAPKSPPPPRVTAAVMPDEKAYKPTKHAPPQSHFPPPAARPADAQHPAVRPHPATQQYGGQRPGAAPTPPASSPPSPPPPPPPPKPPQMTPAPAPVRAPKEGKVLIPATEQTYYADDTPNPEVRLTSPTTVAGGSDDDGDGDMYGGYSRRRRRRRSRSRGRSLAGVVE